MCWGVTYIYVVQLRNKTQELRWVWEEEEEEDQLWWTYEEFMKQFETFEGLVKVLVGHNVIIDVPNIRPFLINN